MSVSSVGATHPILACAEALRSELKAVRDAQPLFLSPSDKEGALAALHEVEAMLAELTMRLLAGADDAAAEHGARDVAPWAAHHLKADPGALRRQVELARALDRRFEVLRRAMADGVVSAPKAHIVAAALDDLPGDLDPETLAQAEQVMVEEAQRFAPAELRQIGRKLLQTIAPDVSEEEEARKLAEQEREARRRTSLRLRPQHDGTTRISGVMPDAEAARLRIYLDSFSAPRNQRDADGNPLPVGEVAAIPADRRRGQSFLALLERLDPARLPQHGGDATTLVVTMSLDQLRSDLATAGILGSDTRMSAAEARRLACNAGIIPVVLDGKGKVLDLGRTQRLFNAAQRKAMRLRHKHCCAEGCDIPVIWTEAHHLEEWASGGRTDLDNAIALCSWHHHRAHDPTYEMVPLGDDQFRFRKRR